MTIILEGHTYKYEIEAVVKIFYSATRFNFIPTDGDTDFCIARLRRFKGCSYALTRLHVGGKTLRRAVRLDAESKDFDAKCEATFCRMIYAGLRNLTGISSPWGMLTGIRPVKLVRRRLAENPDRGALYGYFRRKYLVPSREKLDLALTIADVQKRFLDALPQNGFGLYVGIPFCPTRCSYCSFVSRETGRSAKLIPEYTKLLCRELEYIAQIVTDTGMRPDTVYFGGGTPTALEAEQLNMLLYIIENSFDLSALREYCVEAGRPDTITVKKLQTLLNHGISRISINPQTLKQDTLDLIGRRHTTAQFFDSFRLAREMGFRNINTDLIAGLPRESAEDFRRTLDGVLRLEPEGVTVHTLTVKRSADMFTSREENADTAEMVEYALETLMKAGYVPYYLYRQKNTTGNLENVGYSKPGFESLYNIYIMEECQSILAAGCAGSSKIIGERVTRVCNYKYPNEYITDFDGILRKKDELKKYIQGGLHHGNI